MNASTDRRAPLVARIRADREFWRSLVSEVGSDRLNEPGPMGAWTFGDLAGHLAAWRERTVHRIEAAARGEPEPAAPWPRELDGDDRINAWIRERDKDSSAAALVDRYDASFEHLAGAIERLPDDLFTSPTAFPWAGGKALADADFTAHLHEEHVPAVREWLAKR